VRTAAARFSRGPSAGKLAESQDVAGSVAESAFMDVPGQGTNGSLGRNNLGHTKAGVGNRVAQGGQPRKGPSRADPSRPVLRFFSGPARTPADPGARFGDMAASQWTTEKGAGAGRSGGQAPPSGLVSARTIAGTRPTLVGTTATHANFSVDRREARVRAELLAVQRRTPGVRLAGEKRNAGPSTPQAAGRGPVHKNGVKFSPGCAGCYPRIEQSPQPPRPPGI